MRDRYKPVVRDSDRPFMGHRPVEITVRLDPHTNGALHLTRKQAEQLRDALTDYLEN